MTVLETDRLRLERFIPDDAPFMLGLLNEPSFLENIGDRGVRTVDEARQYLLDGAIASYSAHGFGLYRVDLKTSDPAAATAGPSIGTCGLVQRDGLDDADLGFALLPAYWRRGYAVEAAAAVKRYAFETLGLPRLLAITNPDNLGSIKVLERVGLRFDRMIRLGDEASEIRLYTSDQSAPSDS